MKKTSIIFYLFAILLWSCSEFQEPQLDNDRVEVLTPRDSLRTSVVTQQFFWYQVDDAIDYEIQIVSPSFDQIDRFIVDTIITKNKISFTLTPGNYQWSVRAFNNSSASPYTTSNLFIDSTIDLTTQTLQLSSPKANDTTNQNSPLFKWQTLYNADQYSFQLWQPDETGSLIHQSVLVGDTLSLVNLPEGAYFWKVRAQNQLTNSVFSKRTFFIDTTSPSMPILVLPDSNSTVGASNINFEWIRGGSNSGSRIIDSLFISPNSNFSNFSKLIRSSVNQVVVDTLSVGDYFWRVKSYDVSGNLSDFSSTRKFSVN